MLKLITITALTATMALAAADAFAGSRHGTVNGPRGTSTIDTHFGCSGGSCSRDTTRTGAQGKTVTTSGNATCSSGSCSGTKTITGPNGKEITRNGSVTW